MTTRFVRPDTSHSGTRNGDTYETAWGGWSEVVWGVSGVTLGDTLYLCGVHGAASNITLGAHLATSPATKVTIRGDWPASPGAFVFSGTAFFQLTRKWTCIRNMTMFGVTTRPCIAAALTQGFEIDGCTLIGGNIGVSLDSATLFTDASVTNNTIYGQVANGGARGAGISHSISTASLVPSGIVIKGNAISNTDCFGIYIANNSGNYDTGRFSGYKITGNRISDCPGTSIYFRTCNPDQLDSAVVYSTDVEISGNRVDRCGTIAGDLGNHGGLLVMGCESPMVFGNTVRNCYVTGGGIQTAKNKRPWIFFNTVDGIQAGTPTGSFQNGFPIDSNGVFLDIWSVGGYVFGNRISNCMNTGNTGSGVGLAFWNSSGGTFSGNVVTNCAVGSSYGNSGETGNAIHHNTFINCPIGIYKIGGSALAGNVSAKNNLFTRCAKPFVIGANPSITADYNCLHAFDVAYSGIAAGANDISVDPQLDDDFRPRNPRLKRVGTYLGGRDFNGKQFYNPPNIGAVDDLSLTPRYLVGGH